MGIISRIRGMQAQAQYETQHRESIDKIQQQAYEAAKAQRAKEEAAKKLKREADARARAIEKAKQRGVNRAKPVVERVTDNFDEALERAMQNVKIIDQTIAESPKVQKKLRNARYNLNNVVKTAKNVVKHQAPKKAATHRAPKKAVRQHIAAPQVVFVEHPVHAKKSKPTVGAKHPKGLPVKSKGSPGHRTKTIGHRSRDVVLRRR